MLIFLAAVLSIITYGSYRCIRDRSFHFFRRFGDFFLYTFFKADKFLSVLLWGTVACSVVLSNLLSLMGISLSSFNPLSHFLFGFLAREFTRIANDYYPFLDKIGAKLPRRLAKLATPSAFAFILCMGNGIQEEIQKKIPVLRALVWTSLPDQITDTVMDTAGIIVSVKRGALGAQPGVDKAQEEFAMEDEQTDGAVSSIYGPR